MPKSQPFTPHSVRSRASQESDKDKALLIALDALEEAKVLAMNLVDHEANCVACKDDAAAFLVTHFKDIELDKKSGK